MRLYVESRLPCGADQAWDEVQYSRLLQEVAAPLVSVQPLPGEQFPERWQMGASLRCRSFLFGCLPLGMRTLRLERIDSQAREIQSRESDPLVARWDHLIRIEPIAGNACRYSDELEIEAGWLTPLVWLFAAVFYRHRQWKWRGVARRLALEAAGMGYAFEFTMAE